MYQAKLNKPDNNLETDQQENVLFGVIGAFLFSLTGGVMYIMLNLIGFITALSGLVGVVCAIKGYSFFARKESKRGAIISVIIAALVLVIAWYIGFCMDAVAAYKAWFEAGEVDHAPTIFEYIPYGFNDLTSNPLYFLDLLFSLGLGALGCWSYVKTSLIKRTPAPTEEEIPPYENLMPNEEAPTTEEAPITEDSPVTEDSAEDITEE